MKSQNITFDTNNVLIDFISNNLGGIRSVALFVFYAVIILFVIYSSMLFYHWIKYGANSPIIWFGMVAYSAGSFILLVIMYISVINI